MNTGEKIKKIRLDNKLTQDEFAQKLNVTRVAVSKWELGKSYPSIENLKTICSMFNVSFDDLLEEEKANEVNTEQNSEQSGEEKHSSEAKRKSPRKTLDIIAFSVIGVIAVTAITLTSVGLAKTFLKETSEVVLSPIESIYVSEKPTHMTYLVGQSFDTDGMSVTAVREDSSEEVIEGWTIDTPDSFTDVSSNGVYNVTYFDNDSQQEFTTTLDGVNVYKTLRGIFSPNGLVAVEGPYPQKAGNKFNSDGLKLHVTYDVNGETIEDKDNNYKLGDYSSNNSYDVIKLAKNDVLKDTDTSVSIYYSQGKAADIKIDVFTSISASYKKSTFDAKTDKFSTDDIELVGLKSDGSETPIDASIYSWNDDQEGTLSNDYTFVYNGTHILSPIEGNIFGLQIEFNVINGASAGEVDPNLNEDEYFSEAENLEFSGQVATLVQTGDDYTTEYKAKNCTYEKFWAAAYLGYTGKYAASGKGFVLGFDDTGVERSMSFTFNAPGGGSGDLIVRGSTNVSSGTYTSSDLKVLKAAKIYLNGVDISSSLNQDAVFEGVKNSEPDEQNRTGEAGGFSLEGRYRFVNWTEVNLGELKLRRGNNTLKIVANNGTSGGHWDTVKVDIKPYKDGGDKADEISLNKTTSTLNIGESESLICYHSSSSKVTWSSSNESIATVNEDGLVTAIKEGSVTIEAKCGDQTVSCVYTITDPTENPDLNEDTYLFECEDMTLSGKAVALKQTGDDYKTQYSDSCSYAKMHAYAYLGYTGDYAYSGKGFVHNFDVESSMTQTFTLNSAATCDLTIRISSNYGVDGSKYKTNALQANKIAKYTLNGADITSMFTDDMVTKSITSDTPDAQNRNETVDGIDINGRYRFVYWTDITIKGVHMNKGENTLVISANNSNKSGHWDSVSLNFAPYKNK